MVGVVIVAHGDLARALLETATLIAGELEGVEGVSFGAEESPGTLYDKVLEALNRCGDEAILLADLPGGSPANVCARVAMERGCQAVAGVNLPMLIETVLSRDDEHAIALAQTALQAGQEGLVHLNELLPRPGSG